MSDPSNPPIHTEIIKNKKDGDSICYVMERKVQYCQETDRDEVIDLRVLGVLRNSDDDLSLMFPIDEWRKEENERIEQVRLARQEESPVCISVKEPVSAKTTVYSPLHLYAFMLSAYCSKFSDCEVAAVFLQTHKNTLCSAFPGLANIEFSGNSEDLIRRFFVLLGKDRNGGLLHDFSGMDIDRTDKDVRIHRADPLPYVLNVHDCASATILAVDIAGKVTPRKDAAYIDSFLEKIAVRGTLVCTDAQYASAEFVQKVLNDGGDYLVRVTDSTPALQEELVALFRGEYPGESKISSKKENKWHTESNSVSILPGSLLDPVLKKKWPGMDDGLIARLTIRCEAHDGGTSSIEDCYLVSSLPSLEDMSAYYILSSARDPLAVKNSRRLLDIVCFNESSQYKNGEYRKGRMLFEETLQDFIEVAKVHAAKLMHSPSVSRDELQILCFCSEEYIRLYNAIMKKKKK